MGLAQKGNLVCSAVKCQICGGEGRDFHRHLTSGRVPDRSAPAQAHCPKHVRKHRFLGQILRAWEPKARRESHLAVAMHAKKVWAPATERACELMA